MFNTNASEWKKATRQVIYLRPWLHGVLLDTRPVSLEKAIEIFDLFTGREDLDFSHIETGCAERAHIMATEVMDLGYRAYKAWAFADIEVQENQNEGRVKQNLFVKDVEGTILTEKGWAFHVALAMPVQTQKNRVDNFVFDHSLFDGPVPVKEWEKIMNVPVFNEYTLTSVVPFGRVPDGCNYGDYNLSDSTKDVIRNPKMDPRLLMKKYKAMPSIRRPLFPSRYRIPEYQGSLTV